MDQPSFASLAYAGKKKTTRREKFLAEMEGVVPWGDICELIEPHYPKAGMGRRPMPLERMVRIYFLQQWFSLSDPGAEDELYDSESMRRFARIDLGSGDVPDETTICRFRHLIEENELGAALFAQVAGYLEGKGLMVSEGTIVDATIIHAPSSTKNQKSQRDPEMASTKKGNQWYFGMKAHIGTDSKRGLAHTAVVTAANEHDSQVFEDLLHGQEAAIYGDKAYSDAKKAQAFEERGVRWRVAKRGSRAGPLGESEKKRNTHFNRVRAKVEHIFGVIKNLWGYRKVRYKGLRKNATQVFTLLALANLYLVRKHPAMLGT